MQRPFLLVKKKLMAAQIKKLVILIRMRLKMMDRAAIYHVVVGI